MAVLVLVTVSQTGKRLLLIDDFDFGLQKSPIHGDKLAKFAPAVTETK